FTVPVGAVAFVAVPLTWDFATSGHEGSAGYLWIGLSFYALARRAREIRVDLRPPVDRPAWMLVVIGSGALVRPELAIYTLSFVALWLVLHRGARGSWVKALAWAFGPTVAYQVFRMGYYALLLPNTALAKLGGPLGSSLGFHYLNSFVHPFVLWLPLGLLALLLVVLLRRADWDQRLVVAAIEVPALIHVAYLVSIGGDYVNGRLLVVPFLAIVAPVSVVALDRFTAGSPSPRLRPVFIGATVVIALWASSSASTLRPPWRVTSADFLDSKYDAREIAVRRWVGEPPRKIADYENTFLVGPYKELVLQYDTAGGDLMIVDDSFMSQAVVLDEGEGQVIASPTIGALGVVAGIDVRIIDRLALADPLASHMPAEGTAPGHLRRLPMPWVYGRMGLDADPASAAAIEAEGCGGIAQILDDTSGSLGPADIISNIIHAPANTRLKVPEDPTDAVDTFC
ncbi:MAG: putative permease, partial [Ilumatobacteraceae bacterium]|nr:putative permease [Ilumatobacteraceae bacterium]